MGVAAPRPRWHVVPRSARRDCRRRPRSRRRDLHPRCHRRPAGGRGRCTGTGIARRPADGSLRLEARARRYTSCQTRAAARNAAAALPEVGGYAFVSSLNAYANWPPGPIGPEDDEPTWSTDEDEYGPIKAYAERVLGAVHGERFLTARAGLIVGPHDPVHRLGRWLDRLARGGRVAVPDAFDQPMAVVDARDLAGWLVGMAERGRGGAVNTTGPVGMITLGELLDLCRAVTGSDAEWVPIAEEELLAAGVQPWVHLPFWLPHETARTAWNVDTTRARELGLPSRQLAASIADTWAWQRAVERRAIADRQEPGLPAELEAELLSRH